MVLALWKPLEKHFMLIFCFVPGQERTLQVWGLEKEAASWVENLEGSGTSRVEGLLWESQPGTRDSSEAEAELKVQVQGVRGREDKRRSGGRS